MADDHDDPSKPKPIPGFGNSPQQGAGGFDPAELGAKLGELFGNMAAEREKAEAQFKRDPDEAHDVARAASEAAVRTVRRDESLGVFVLTYAGFTEGGRQGFAGAITASLSPIQQSELVKKHLPKFLHDRLTWKGRFRACLTILTGREPR